MRISFRKLDTNVIELIRNGDERVMEDVYFKYRSEFVGWSKTKFGIQEEDALDHYQDTLTIFFEKVMNGSIQSLESSLKTYLFGIGKNKVKQRFEEEDKKDRHEPGVVEHYQFLAKEDESLALYEEARNQTEALFYTIGDACKEILRLFYFEKRSMSEISQLMGHKSEAVSRTTKKRCLDKIRAKANKPLTNG